MTLPVLVEADGHILDQILDATHVIWHDDLARNAYAQWWRVQRATSWGARHLRRWALVDGTAVLATAKVYDMDGVLDGRPVRIAGLGAVFTMPAHRGRGHARHLLEQLLELATRGGFDVALLFSEIGPTYYERLGFEAIPLSDLTIRVREDDRRGAPAMMVRAGDDRDLAAVAAIDSARAAASRFHLTRERDLVQFAMTKKRLLAGLGQPGARELRFLVAEEGATAAAYVVLSVKQGEWTIDACGDRDPAGARLGGLLQTIVARDPAERRPAIRAWLPESFRPPQIDVVAAAPSRDVMMIRPLSERGRPGRSLAAADVVYWRGDAF